MIVCMPLDARVVRLDCDEIQTRMLILRRLTGKQPWEVRKRRLITATLLKYY